MCSGVRTKRAASLSRLQPGKGPLPTLPQALHRRQAAQAALSSNQPPRTGTTATKRITSSVETSLATISCQSVPVWSGLQDLKSSCGISLSPGKTILVAVAQPHTVNQRRRLLLRRYVRVHTSTVTSDGRSFLPACPSVWTSRRLDASARQLSPGSGTMGSREMPWKCHDRGVGVFACQKSVQMLSVRSTLLQHSHPHCAYTQPCPRRISARHLNACRAQDRHGVPMEERALASFTPGVGDVVEQARVTGTQFEARQCARASVRPQVLVQKVH